MVITKKCNFDWELIKVIQCNIRVDVKIIMIIVILGESQ